MIPGISNLDAFHKYLADTALGAAAVVAGVTNRWWLVVPEWVRPLQEWLGLAIAIGGLILIIYRNAIARIELRKLRKAEKHDPAFDVHKVASEIGEHHGE